jgi:hypothetical protein
MGDQEAESAIVWLEEGVYIQNVITDFTVVSVFIILSQ